MSSFYERRDALRWGIYHASHNFLSVSDICQLASTDICSHYALRDFIQAERREITEQQENLYFWWLQFEPQGCVNVGGRGAELNSAYALDLYIFHLPYIVNETEKNVELTRLQTIFTDVHLSIQWSEQEEEAYWSDDDHPHWDAPNLYSDSD